ncbi:hypothetical protein JOE40_002194 [Arthrobacter sp. PvP102]|uniref:hypothetical protein n=1 Tax=unclassified Arthrobacter TaxID=235627 RepID=UPI001AE1BF35|nr:MULTISPECIES: hypothetical protein [unclassified Arthrobacter]MBP1232550.1 hypothetical protein [Arthrobacter sp. PvP103]MBP1237685.1 hypothetical protein [Arthrobacter sp. PvP102]
MGIFPEGQEPKVYVFGFANLQSLKDGFTSYTRSGGIREGDVQYPPAAGFWGFPADPPDMHRGQLLSQVRDGEALFIWTDWTELTWISAESNITDVKTLFSWWGKGNR